MNPAQERFKIQLAKVGSLLNEAAIQENPAIWLYEHDLRTPAFMLESLARIYKNLHNKKTFTKLLEKFKTLEDALGQIDYYVVFGKEFKQNKKISSAINQFFDHNANEHIALLNEELKDNGWLNGKQIKKINNKLNELEWLNEKQEAKAISKFYNTEIAKIQDFVLQTNFMFDDIEAHVHELRRKLRWLSIYCQSLNGLVQLEEKTPVAKHLAKYLTPAIINSPYNKLPESKSLSRFIVLEKNNFFALSWMIAQLGTIKDNGLRVTILTEVFQEVESLSAENANKKAVQVLGNNYPQMQELLAEASKITKQYVSENNLINLFYGLR